MAFPKITDARKLSESELADQIVAVKRQLFDIRMRRATSQPFKPHEFKHQRHRLAQLLTVERERQLGINQKSSTEEG
jgi:large subunit ribosomal protein L29